MLWAAWLVALYPYDGILRVGPDGEVLELSRSGPAAGIVEVGDVIRTVEGVPLDESTQAFARLRPGETAHFTVTRDDRTLELAVPVREAPARDVWRALSPLLVAFALSVVGAFVFSLVPVGRRSVLFYLLCQAMSAGLGLGLISIAGSQWSVSLFYVLLWFATPGIVHFHLTFPEERRESGRRLLAVLYAIAAAGSLPFLLWGPAALKASSWYGTFYVVGRLYLVAGVLTGVWLLLRSQWRAATAAARRQARSVLLAGGLALVLFVVLSILPDALASDPLLPYHISFLLLLAIPLGYGHAVARPAVPEASPAAP
jgi:hypothetical protein